ncbi:MAG: histone [Candidatus Korarchaeota archaeon]|nr:histone [Candidatus Korarchaeota archaeon]NIU83262.1 histone [Candidatus Thorarchaeota archaeon]NIW13606.1 histone [Candidatus Thorarchaeota archaeon]NIW51702.1 histone [Candidatus Korarchaeota archaeon]
MAELPRAGIRRLMKTAGAERMSKDAVISTRDLAEQFCKKLSDVAVTMADHAGRKTVSKEDVKKAAAIMQESKGYF